MTPCKPNGIVTLTTDFGTDGIFVGVMKGILLKINSSVQIIDITHEIRKYNVEAGSFQLNAAHTMFPRGTTHLVVIDPGVGSSRKGIAVETENYFFVGPDNGVLTEAIPESMKYRAVSLESSQYFLSSISSTFHGRDIFAPIAAYISKGVQLAEFGPSLNNFIRIPINYPKVSKTEITGQVRLIDTFGNIITNINEKIFRQTIQNQDFEIQIKNCKIGRLSKTYSNGPRTVSIALFNSYGLLEIALNQGHAAKELNVSLGDQLQIRFM